MDILGFKDFVNRTHESVESVPSIISALDIRPSLPAAVFDGIDVRAEAVDLRIHTFSDFVVSSTLPSPGGLAVLAYVMWELSTRWLSNSFLCRGGVARGKVLHRSTDDGSPPMVFGPAFIEAYQLESNLADYPRIIFSRAVREDWLKFKTSGSLGEKVPRLVHKCEDGPHCIDGFSHLKENGFDAVMAAFPVEADQIRKAILKQLNDSAEVPSVHRKVLWLADKFNAATTGNFKLGIDLKNYQ